MAIAFVQTATGAGASNPLSTSAFGSSTTSGNLIVVALTSSAVAPFSVKDSVGNAYTLITSVIINNIGMSIFYSANIIGGASFTCTGTYNATSSQNCIMASEFSGVALKSPFSRLSIRGAPTSAIPSTSPMASTQSPNSLIVSFVGCTTTGITVGSGFSNLSTITAGANFNATESKIVSSVGEYNAVYGAPTSNQWTCGVVAFSDIDVAQPTTLNNFQFAKALDGISVTEKIR